MTETCWIDVAATEAVAEGDVVGCGAGGVDVALYRVNGELHATANTCTHGQGRLCDGFLMDHEIECPLHQGRFDIRSGQVLCAPLTENLRVFPVKVEAGRVLVCVQQKLP